MVFVFYLHMKHILALYTDGACSDNGKDKAIAAGGFYVPEQDLTYRFAVPGLQTNNRAELIGLIEAFRWIELHLHEYDAFDVVTDSMYCMWAVKNYAKWLYEIARPNLDLIRQLAAVLKTIPKSKFTLRRVDGHRKDKSADTRYNNHIDAAVQAYALLIKERAAVEGKEAVDKG